MYIDRRQALHIFIKGENKGVSFLSATLLSSRLRVLIQRWVRNNPNGDVEDFAQGDKTKSYLFTTGAIYYRVNDMKLLWEHADRIIQIIPLSNKCNSKYIPIYRLERKKQINYLTNNAQLFQQIICRSSQVHFRISRNILHRMTEY